MCARRLTIRWARDDIHATLPCALSILPSPAIYFCDLALRPSPEALLCGLALRRSPAV
jgi:hypothetical protein